MKRFEIILTLGRIASTAEDEQDPLVLIRIAIDFPAKVRSASVNQSYQRNDEMCGGRIVFDVMFC